MSKKLIRLSKSCISAADKKAVMGVLDREFLGMGDDVKIFEEQLTEFFGRPAVCVATGTAALHLALQACGIKEGDEVLVPSLTYVASFQAISATGARPIACDIDPETLVLDWKDAEQRLTSHTKAIMPVHYSGGVGDLEGIYNFADRHSLRVIEDAAHAFGTKYKNKNVGGFGDVVSFSFDGIKNITSGDGGCIVTDDKTLLRKINDARLLGVEKDTEKRFTGKRSWDFDVNAQGWRYHMSNIMAALGNEQLKRINEISLLRQSIAMLYDELLKDIQYIKTIKHNYSDVVPHIYVIILESHEICENVKRTLADNGIETGVHYKPNHLLSYYSDNNIQPLPITEDIYRKIITLPLHPDLFKEDVKYICGVLAGIQNDR
jgi:dTDP-4-amino-4,6-dideoxygalactose transaminase